MKLKITICLIFSCLSLGLFAQNAETAFHQGANLYVKGNIEEATQTVASALQKYPSDPKLNSLMEKLKKEEQENKDKDKDKEDKNDEKEKEDKDKGEEGQNQEDQEKEGEDKNEEKGEEKEKGKQENEGDKEGKESGEENEEGKEGEKDDLQKRKERFDQMNLTEEKAQMILDAMKNNEVQYIQQNRRKVRENANYGKPDW